MTKKDFIIVARAIKLQVDRQREDDNAGSVEAINRVAWELCREFRGANTRFDDYKFMAACGFENDRN